MAGLTLIGSGMAYGQYQAFPDDEAEDALSFEQIDEGGGGMADDRNGIADPHPPAIEPEGDQVTRAEQGTRTRDSEDETGIQASPSIDLDIQRETCREAVDAYMQGLSIAFASGNARMTPESERVLVELSDILEGCPDVPVFVEGHTDADGSAALNLTLSLARAEAVVEDLIELGIAPNRLYAVGYGAGLPIASNETAAGKAQNRRIVFSFEDIAEPLEDEGS